LKQIAPVSAERTLSAIFLEAGGVAPSSGDELESALRKRVDAARAVWREIALTDEALVRHIAAHATDGEKFPALAYAADLMLACACASGDNRAVAAFEREYAELLERTAARVDASSAEEIAQQLRERLLVRTKERAPRIAEYGGRSKLSTWLAAVAAREAISAKRKQGGKAYASLSEVAAAAPALSPEIEVARARYATDFREAIREALTRIEPQQRALLRMSFSLGFSIDRIGEIRKVSRATAARHLASAREALHDETRKVIASRLKLTTTEIESLAAVLQSDIQLSITALLGKSDSGSGDT
jgi:RNA polymerase sigma-70 factor (ECF subfamily)